MTLVANHPKTLLFETTDGGVARGVTIAGEHIVVGAALGVATSQLLGPLGFILGGVDGRNAVMAAAFFAHTIGVPLWRYGYAPMDLALTIPTQMLGASIV